jgi:hypothetical protein
MIVGSLSDRPGVIAQGKFVPVEAGRAGERGGDAQEKSDGDD